MTHDLILHALSKQSIPLPLTMTSLSALTMEHMESIREWRNEQSAILRQNNPISKKEQDTYWHETLVPAAEMKEPPLILFSITDKEKLLGYGGLTRIDWFNKHAEISFLLDTKIPEESERFSSLFSECLHRFEQIAFQELGLKKLIAEVFAFRKPMIAYLKKASFHEEGRLREHIQKNGKWYDSLLFTKKAPKTKERALLVTSLSQKAPLITSIRNALGTIGESFRIIGCDMNQNCLGRFIVDSFWNSPSWNSPTAANDLFDFCAQNNVSGIIPTGEAELAFFSNLAPSLRKKGIATLSSPPETVSLCQDKWDFYQYCSKHALPVIPSFLSQREVPSTKIMVKERFSTSPKSHVTINTHDEPPNCFHAPLFQPLIDGVEYSIDVYRSRHTNEVRAFVRRRNVIQDSEAVLTTPTYHPSLEELVKKASQILSIEGHAVFQAIEARDHSLLLIECNPRIGGASTASFANGLASIEWFILEDILNQPLPSFTTNMPHFPQVRIREDLALVSPSSVYST